MPDADRARPDEEADPPPAAPAAADPPPGDLPSSSRLDRDPAALAGWRRVAEQRDRRRPTGDDDAESVDAADTAEAADAAGPEDAPGSWAASLRPPGFAPRSSPDPAAAARADGPYGAPTEHGGPRPAGRVHDALLGLAGRIDDDALSWVRELVAVEDDAGAAELLGGCLLADAVALTPSERAVLGPWFGATRVDPGILGLLPTDLDAVSRVRHRFVAEGPAGTVDDGWGDAGAVARAVSRLPGVKAVGQCWRVTPAGVASGALPHRVVVVQTEATVDGEHVAHHVAHAARDLGPVSVEVVAVGASLPAYHRDALAACVPMLSPVPSHEQSADAEEWHTVAEAAPAPGVVSESDLLLGELPFGDADPPPEPVAPDDSPPSADMPAEPADSVESEDEEDRQRDEVAPDEADLDEVAPDETGADRDELAAARDESSAERDEAAEDEPAWDDDEPTGEAVDAERPDPLDPDEAAARIAALWREPSPADALGERGFETHEPVASYDWGFGRLTPAPEGRDEPEGSGGPQAGPVPEHPDGLETPDPLPPGAGRIQRARTSRAAEWSAPASPDAVALPAATAPEQVNGHHHGGVDGARPGPDTGVADDPPTDPLGWRFDPTPQEPAGPDSAPQEPAPQEPARPSGARPAGTMSTASASAVPPTAAPGPNQESETPAGPDTGSTEALGLPVDPGAPNPPDDSIAQLSDRERDLLARLHDELAARERAGSDLFESPGPWSGSWGPGHSAYGRPTSAPPEPGPDPAPPTAPLPPSAPGGTNGHVNGHGLPPRGFGDEHGT